MNEQNDGLVTMQAPEGATELSFEGQTYQVVDGAVDVPHAAVAEMLSHGFTVVVAQEQAETSEGVTAVKEQKRRGRPAKSEQAAQATEAE
jgi:hypothetical protein